MPEIPLAVVTSDTGSTTTTSKSIIQEAEVVETEKSSTAKPVPFLSAHENSEVESATDATKEEEETTAEPLETIYITDPSTIDPAATAGKWPTEPPTEIPVTDNDADNEA